MIMNEYNVGILIFNDVEVLDFAGPFEVFSRTRLTPGIESRRNNESAPFNVFTVAKEESEIKAIGGLKVVPDFGFESAPKIDIIVVPGGFGTREIIKDSETLDWIKSVTEKTELTTSVCTGAIVYAKLGLLKNKKATTHWGALELLSKLDSSIDIQSRTRFVDDGIITAAGVAAGIEMSFYVVEKLCGKSVADETAEYIEFKRQH